MNTAAKRYVVVEEPSSALNIIADIQLRLEEIHDLLLHISKRFEQIAGVVGETHSFVSTLQLRVEDIEAFLQLLKEHLPSVCAESPKGQKDLVAFFRQKVEEGQSYRELRAVAESAIVVAALETTGGNCTAAARRIGMSRFGLSKARDRHPK